MVSDLGGGFAGGAPVSGTYIPNTNQMGGPESIDDIDALNAAQQLAAARHALEEHKRDLSTQLNARKLELSQMRQDNAALAIQLEAQGQRMSEQFNKDQLAATNPYAPSAAPATYPATGGNVVMALPQPLGYARGGRIVRYENGGPGPQPPVPPNTGANYYPISSRIVVVRGEDGLFYVLDSTGVSYGSYSNPDDAIRAARTISIPAEYTPIDYGSPLAGNSAGEGRATAGRAPAASPPPQTAPPADSTIQIVSSTGIVPGSRGSLPAPLSTSPGPVPQNRGTATTPTATALQSTGPRAANYVMPQGVPQASQTQASPGTSGLPSWMLPPDDRWQPGAVPVRFNPNTGQWQGFEHGQWADYGPDTAEVRAAIREKGIQGLAYDVDWDVTENNPYQPRKTPGVAVPADIPVGGKTPTGGAPGSANSLAKTSVGGKTGAPPVSASVDGPKTVPVGDDQGFPVGYTSDNLRAVWNKPPVKNRGIQITGDTAGAGNPAVATTATAPPANGITPETQTQIDAAIAAQNRSNSYVSPEWAAWLSAQGDSGAAARGWGYDNGPIDWTTGRQAGAPLPGKTPPPSLIPALTPTLLGGLTPEERERRQRDALGDWRSARFARGGMPLPMGMDMGAGKGPEMMDPGRGDESGEPPNAVLGEGQDPTDNTHRGELALRPAGGGLWKVEYVDSPTAATLPENSFVVPLPPSLEQEAQETFAPMTDGEPVQPLGDGAFRNARGGVIRTVSSRSQRRSSIPMPMATRAANGMMIPGSAPTVMGRTVPMTTDTTMPDLYNGPINPWAGLDHPLYGNMNQIAGLSNAQKQRLDQWMVANGDLSGFQGYAQGLRQKGPGIASYGNTWA